MKFTAALALAGVATASHQHPRHFHYRRANETTSAGSLTTLTVIATEVHTVTSCKPTVTNCPAANNTAAITNLPSDALTTGVVTNIVHLTTTVCPVTEAAAISSSVVAAHTSGNLPGKIITPETPYPTGTGVVVKPTDVVTEATLTYTLGPSGQQTVVTTTLTSTIKSQVTVTLAKPTGGAGDDSTTTSTLTSTGTRTVKVGKATSSVKAQGGSGSDSGSGSGSGSEDCPTAVTVTLPAETVYVTVTGSAPVSEPTAKVVNNGSKATDPTEDEEECTDEDGADGEDEEECDAEESGVVTATATATVVPYPVPSGNGTAPAPTGGIQFRRHHYNY